MSNTKTIEERIQVANDTIKKAEAEEPKCKGAFKVWSKADKVRIYSDGNGFLEVDGDGEINAIKRMGWGHIISKFY